LRFSISPSVGGTPEYQETITASTDGFGMVNVVIGAVNPSGFAAISWVTGTKYLKVELDHTGSCNGSNTFSGVSEQPFTTVPFALYALNSGSGGGGGSTTTTLTGDVSGSGTGSFATTLAPSGVVAGVYGSATAVPTITVDAKGRITSATTTPIAGGSPIGSALNNGNIIIGDGSNVATAVPITGDITLTNAGSTTVTKINGISLSGLTSGILKNTTSTGVPSIASAADFPQLNQNTTGTANNVTGIIAISNGGTGSATKNFVDLNNDQTVAGDKTFSGNTSIGGNLDVTGITSTAGINDSVLIAVNNVTAAGTLGVTGITSTAGINDSVLIAANNVTAAGTLGVTGLTSTSGINDSVLIAANNVTAAGTLGITGITSTAGINDSVLIAANNVTAAGTLGVTGITSTAGINDSVLIAANNVTAAGTLGVTGMTSTAGINDSALIAANNVTASGTLGVTGDTTLNGNLTVADNILLGGNLVVNDDATITHTLGVTGATTLNNNLTVRGLTSGVLTNKFTVDATTGNTTVAGTLNAGTSTLNSAVVTNDASVGGDLNITGTTTAADINASGTLGVTGATTLNNNLTVRGLTSGVLTDKFTVNAINGDTTVDGKLNVNKIVDNNAVIDILGNDNITINSMSGRFRFPFGLSKIKVYNSNVNINSIILCTVTKNIFQTSYNTNNYILSVDADNLFFTVTLLSAVNTVDKFDINFLVINNNL
jgi:hypothetical protein